MKKIIEMILAPLARSIIKKYKPNIVGITGSVGKTSAKEAVFAVLNSKFHCQRNVKNYNNELGVPLTIIGAESGGKSVGKWLAVFWTAIKLLIKKDAEYPEVLVLEMGADKPGDIDYLLSIAPLDAAVVTKVGPTHLEFFGSVENVAKEKSQIIVGLPATGFCALNFDDPLVKKMEKKTKARVIFFGQSEEAAVRSIDLNGQSFDADGLKFKISHGGSTVPLVLPGIIGKHQIYAALAATAVGIGFGMNLIEITDGLKNYKSPRGRMQLIAGVNGSLIVDDSYNSSPDAARAAVEAVANLKLDNVKRRVAIMGDMLELGDATETAHYELGNLIAKNKFDLLICVGKNKDVTAIGALENGLSKVLKFNDSNQGDEIKNLIEENDLILVKGSQGSRMERIVKQIMNEPEKARELLVRQGQMWN